MKEEDDNENGRKENENERITCNQTSFKSLCMWVGRRVRVSVVFLCKAGGEGEGEEGRAV